MAKHSTAKLVGLVGLGGAAVAGLGYAVNRAKAAKPVGTIAGATGGNLYSLKGKSGANWAVQYISQKGPSSDSFEYRLFWYPPAAAGGAAQLVPVCDYIQLSSVKDIQKSVANDKATRVVEKWYDPTNVSLNTAAKQDLNLLENQPQA